MKFSPIGLTKISNDLKAGHYLVRHNGVELPIYYLPGVTKKVVISFHGAIDRTRFQVPKFQSVATDLLGAHQIRVADPTLGLSDDISIGWYLGGEGMPLQRHLPGMLEAISNSLSIERRIYFGGSAGGFTALYCSLQDSKSACLVINPQVDLHVYNRNMIGKYMAVAWPSKASLGDVSNDLVLNLPKAYAAGFENMVVYLQSAADMRHYERQFPKFCRVAVKNVNNFILQCSYWGVPGHARSIPPSAFLPWLKALISADTLERQDILDTYHAIVSSSLASSSIQQPHQLEAKHAADDLKMASLLRDSQLHAGKGV